MLGRAQSPQDRDRAQSARGPQDRSRQGPRVRKGTGTTPREVKLWCLYIDLKPGAAAAHYAQVWAVSGTP